MKTHWKLFVVVGSLLFLLSGCGGEQGSMVEMHASGLEMEEPASSDSFAVAAAYDEGALPPIVSISVSTPAPAVPAVVEASVLNVREGPDTTFPILGSVSHGESLQVLGQFRACDWLRVSTRLGEQGWVKSGQGYARYEGNCAALPSGLFRPLNGTLVYDRRVAYGAGTLVVENLTLSDSLVVVATGPSAPLVAFYLRSLEHFTVTGFPDSEYQLFFSYGQGWDGNQNRFMVVDAIKQMDQPLEFFSDETGYTTYTLSLNSLEEAGSGSASDIPADRFPDLR